MSTTAQRTPRSGRQSLFFQDLASPVNARRGKFSSPGQSGASSSLWRENFGNSDLPPPPFFTLEDRSDFSPESGILDYQMSPETKSDNKTPIQTPNREFSTPAKGKSEASTSYALRGVQQNQQGSLSLNWWSSPAKSGGEQEEKGRGSPVEGVVQPGALITLPPPPEVARPEVQRNSLPAGNLNEEEWVFSIPLRKILQRVLFQMKPWSSSRQVCNLFQGFPPLPSLFVVISKPFAMLRKSLCKRPLLVPHIGGIHIVEDRANITTELDLKSEDVK